MAGWALKLKPASIPVLPPNGQNLQRRRTLLMTSGQPATATRSSCSGLVRLSAAHGTITDSSHKSNTDCKWLIALNQVNITLQLDEIDLESEYDFLIVYDAQRP